MNVMHIVIACFVDIDPCAIYEKFMADMQTARDGQYEIMDTCQQRLTYFILEEIVFGLKTADISFMNALRQVIFSELDDFFVVHIVEIMMENSGGK